MIHKKYLMTTAGLVLKQVQYTNEKPKNNNMHINVSDEMVLG